MSAASQVPRALRVLQYNVLLEELSSNFVPRTMREPATHELQRAFAETEVGERWATLSGELNAEYAKWHPLKTIIRDPSGTEARVRALWAEPDLTQLAGQGWDLQGLDVSDAQRLGPARTLLGVLTEKLGADRGWGLYEDIRKVHESSCVWSVRGAKVLRRIEELGASVLALQEYDMHELPTAGYPSFKAAMAALGYEGACFRGPGQAAMGVGLFWKPEELRLAEGACLPESGVVLAGEDLGSVANLDFEEPGLRQVDRRSLALARLETNSGQRLLLCGMHLMTTARDKNGEVRAFELTRLRDFLGSRAGAQEAVLLCGDFNIDMRAGREEHVWRGSCGSGLETGYESSQASGAGVLRWRRADSSELLLCDAYGDVNRLAESSSSRTSTRLETIDYIFYDEVHLRPVAGSRSTLRCPEEPMPNEQEPSDHIPLVISFWFDPPGEGAAS